MNDVDHMITTSKDILCWQITEEPQSWHSPAEHRIRPCWNMGVRWKRVVDPSLSSPRDA